MPKKNGRLRSNLWKFYEKPPKISKKQTKLRKFLGCCLKIKGGNDISIRIQGLPFSFFNLSYFFFFVRCKATPNLFFPLSKRRTRIRALFPFWKNSYRAVTQILPGKYFKNKYFRPGLCTIFAVIFYGDAVGKGVSGRDKYGYNVFIIQSFFFSKSPIKLWRFWKYF